MCVCVNYSASTVCSVLFCFVLLHRGTGLCLGVKLFRAQLFHVPKNHLYPLLSTIVVGILSVVIHGFGHVSMATVMCVYECLYFHRLIKLLL